MRTAASEPKVLQVQVDTHMTPKDFEDITMQTLLPNIWSIVITNVNREPDPEATDEDNEKSLDNDTVPGRILRTLDEKCSCLERLHLNNTTIPSTEKMSTYENLLRRLKLLTMHCIVMKSHEFLSAKYHKLKEFHINASTIENGQPFEGLRDVRMPNLKRLHLMNLQDFSDDDLFNLIAGKSTLLKELNLTSLKMSGKQFGRLGLANLKSLYVNECEFVDEWFLELKHLRRLEQLSVSNMHFTDDCPRDAFKYCTQIELIEFESSDYGNRTVSAMARYLPNLKRWVLRPSEDGLVTDEAFDGLVNHAKLEEIAFDRVQLTDVGLRQIALLTPNLTELSLNVCTAGDDAISVVAQLASLVKLTLRGSRITDAGFAQLEPRFGELTEFVVDSRLATADSFKSMVPLLTSIKNMVLRLGDPEHELFYNDSEYSSNLYLNRFASDLAASVLRRFKDVMAITFENMAICEPIVDAIRDDQSKLVTFIMRNCEIPDDLVAPLTAPMTAVTDFNMWDARLSESSVAKLVQGVAGHGHVERLYIENEPFPNVEALKAILPMTSRCATLEIRTFQYEKNITINNQPEYKNVNINAGTQVDDDVVFQIVEGLPEVTEFIIKDSALTDDGLAQVAPLFTQLTSFVLNSVTLGDSAVAIIGSNFRNLTCLSLECEFITDDGLEALGKQMTSLTVLTIRKSAITDDGVRRLVPKLTEIKYLYLSGNPKLTSELYDYLVNTYPDLGHEFFPQSEETEEQNDGDNEQQQQDQPDADEGAGAGAAAQEANPDQAVQQPNPEVPEVNDAEAVLILPERENPRSPEVPEDPRSPEIPVLENPRSPEVLVPGELFH